MREARVWVNAPSTAAPALEAAVSAAGGTVCRDSDAPNAIVWATDDPPSITPHLGPSVEWVQLSSAGIEDWFAAGVVTDERLWTAAKGVYAGPIAEYVVAMLFAAARGLPEVIPAQHWQPREVAMLAGKTIGIVGAGGIGEALLELLVPLNVHTIAMTRSGRTVARAEQSVGPEELEPLLAQSDYLVLAAPETPSTTGLLSARRLDLLRPGAWIVNVGRGTIIETEALVDALASGRLGGAALDVTDPEPLPDGHPLWALPNAIITSHTACTPGLGAQAFAQRVQDNVALFSRGRPLLGTVDSLAQY